MMYQGRRVGIVVPAYNEELMIAEALNGMPEIADRVYVIDDGSADRTSDVVRSLGNKRVSLLRHEVNRGAGAAMITGYKAALADGMDVVVKLDGDSQMDTKYLPDLLFPIFSGKADYAKGNRLSRLSHREGMPGFRYFGNWLLTLLTKVSSGYWNIGDSQNGYTAISQEALQRIDMDKVYPRYGYLNDILVKLNVAGCRVADVPMPARYGKERSKIRYGNFVVTVSPLLLRGFIWRINAKYISRKRGASVYA
jgi:glycosyltransferase involved in cell wall biosynthesis